MDRDGGTPSRGSPLDCVCPLYEAHRRVGSASAGENFAARRSDPNRTAPRMAGDLIPNKRSSSMGLDNPIHLAILLMILLLVFGAKRLPEMGRSLGDGLRGFKDAVSAETPSTSSSAAAPEQLAAAPIVAATPTIAGADGRDAVDARAGGSGGVVRCRSRPRCARRSGASPMMLSLSVVDHLDELRTRMIVALSVLAVAFGLCFSQNQRLLGVDRRATRARDPERRAGGGRSARRDLRGAGGRAGHRGATARRDRDPRCRRGPAARLAGSAGPRQPPSVGGHRPPVGAATG